MTLLLFSLYRILMMVIDAYWILLGLFALLSWFPGAYQSGLGRLVRYFVDPLVKPFRRFRLSIGYVDFTLVVIFFILAIVRELLTRLFGILFLL